MIQLPEPLRRWAAPLSSLSDSTVAALGPWLPRLALAVGPSRPRANSRPTDPDGYGGLARRGPYDRLLISEWVYADAEPDEFLRRAAMNEHSFLELMQSAPAGSRRTVALFDAGPSQLGAPRIAQLALLIVLAQRAAEGGAELCWGVLQDKPELRIGALADDLGAFVSARSSREAISDMLDAWRTALAHDVVRDELLVIGGARTKTLRLASSGFIEIQEPRTEGDWSLRVSVAIPQRNERLAVLPLPHAAACVNVLRNPRGTAAVIVTVDKAHGPVSELLLLPEAHRLIFRTADGGLWSQYLPGSPNEPVPAAVRLRIRDTEVVHAIGFWRGTYLALVREGDELRLQRIGKKGQRAEPASAPMSLLSAPPKLREAFAGHDVSLWHLTRLEASSGSVTWFTSTVGGQLCLIRSTGVISLTQQQLLAVQRVPVMRAAVWQQDRVDRELEIGVPRAVDGAVVGEARQATSKPQVFLGQGHELVSTEGNRWSLGRQSLIAPHGTAVIGTLSELGGVMVLLEADRRTVSIVNQHAARTLFTLGSPIEQVRVSAEANAIVGVAAGGELFAFSVRRNAFILRRVGGKS